MPKRFKKVLSSCLALKRVGRILSLVALSVAALFFSQILPAFAKSPALQTEQEEVTAIDGGADTDVISNDGDISYDSATKTLRISGEISDIDIVQARRNGNWFQTVENVLFQPGTRLLITQSRSTGNPQGLFSSTYDTETCSNLKNITMNNVTYVNATGDENAYCILQVGPYCDKVISCDMSSPTIEAIGTGKLSLYLVDSTSPVQTLNLKGWGAAIFSVGAGGGYEGPNLYNWTNLSSITASAQYWQNIPSLRNEDDPFPQGNWVLTTDFVNYTTVPSYVEWKAYCKDLPPSQTVYCTISNAPEIQTTFNANGGYFNTQGEETVTTSTHPDVLLSLPPENPLNSNPAVVFLGYAQDSQATDAEIIPGDTTTYPIAMEAAGIYYAVWQDAPGPTPPGPTPDPTPDPVPDVTPASDDASLLPITGDTQHASISAFLAAACIGTALLGMAGVFTRHRD